LARVLLALSTTRTQLKDSLRPHLRGKTMIREMTFWHYWSHVGAAFAVIFLFAGCSGSSVGEVDSVFLTAAGSWDRNHDNVVTCEEWKAYAAELFDAADANRDSIVDTAEYGKIVSTDRMFQTVGFGHYDANGDGKLTRAEFVDKPNRAFVLLDQNNECRLTGTQVAGARARTEQTFEHKKSESGDPRDNPTPGVPQ